MNPAENYRGPQIIDAPLASTPDVIDNGSQGIWGAAHVRTESNSVTRKIQANFYSLLNFLGESLVYAAGASVACQVTELLWNAGAGSWSLGLRTLALALWGLGLGYAYFVSIAGGTHNKRDIIRFLLRTIFFILGILHFIGPMPGQF